jgi:three-Cys-motif partner protein
VPAASCEIITKVKTSKQQSSPKPPKSPQPETALLFDLPEEPPPEPEVAPIHEPIWTENKAKLIERYLYYFVLITKHGTYIDGFAGPQEPDKPRMWAAKLVIESEPRWFRNFFFFEKTTKGIKALRTLRDSQPSKPKRRVEVCPGDCNVEILRQLDADSVKKTEACFCLLDQRTFECQWETLIKLAKYKSSGKKIELFYFLPNHWFGRALTGLKKNKSAIKNWWGRDDWKILYELDGEQRKNLIVKRFKEELGYRSVKPWPIYGRKHGGAIMYYMVHATDHPLAPSLMSRAYRKAGLPKEPVEQLQLELSGE